MTDQSTPNLDLPDWHWHVLLHPEGGRHAAPWIHDSGNWPAATALGLARDLGNQLVGPQWPSWTVMIFPNTCHSGQVELTYRRAEHDQWLADQPATEVLSADSAPTLSPPPPADAIDPLPNPLAADHVHVFHVPPSDGPDAPPAGVAWSPALASLLSTVEPLITEDGRIDCDEMVRGAAHALTLAMFEALSSEDQGDPNSFWYNDDHQLALVMSTAATLIAAHIRRQARQ